MVISDFNIICLGQSTPELITCEKIGVDVITSKDGYGLHWKTLSNSNGIWYQFYPLEREITKQYNDEFFDLTVIDMKYVAVSLENHVVGLKNLVDTYLSLSPIHEILLLIRLDEHGESDDVSDLTAEDFASNLYEDKLQFNKIYHIIQ